VYCAVVLDTFSRRVVGRSIDSSQTAALVTNALSMAIANRDPQGGGIIRSDHGVQFTSWALTDRAKRSGVVPSIGSIGDCYDALAEAVNAAYKTEVIHRAKPWRCVDDVELATAEWVAWYNQERLHEALGYRTPAEYEAALTGTSHPANQPTPALATD
jgi:putative transposase